MEDYNSHGIDCIEAFITRKVIPPNRYLELIQIEVARISKVHEIAYSRALEYLVRSMVNCCQGKFKKDVRLWMLKRYQAKRPSLELTDYEKELAIEIAHCKENQDEISDLTGCHDLTTYSALESRNFPAVPHTPTPPPQIEIYVPNCPTHKKDCRLWLHKTSDLSRRRAVAGRLCQWYKDNLNDLSGRHSTSSIPATGGGGELAGGNGGVGDGDFVMVGRPNPDTTRQQHHYSRVGFKNNTRYSLRSGLHSNSSSDSEPPHTGKPATHRRQLGRSRNLTCHPRIYSLESDPETDTHTSPPHKIYRRDPENENSNASKTLSDVHQAGPTPSNSSVCTQLSAAHFPHPAETEEVRARQRLEEQVGGRPLSQCELITRSQSYFPVYRSQSFDSGENVDVCPGITMEPLTDFNLNSNPRGRTSSLCSLHSSGSD